MSREDQVNLNSYADTFISSDLFFSRFKIPLESLCPIHLNSLNRLLPYLGAQELTIQGRRVLSQPQRMTFLHWCCSNSNLRPSGANWPHHIFMANLVPSDALWSFGHILPSLASLANSHILNPQASILVLAPLALIIGFGQTLFIRGVLA
ncbi:hypothetical protein O181_075273 [Austropuccinia psidii MF-1]|uniref:Uncharacterized protein n=1 Tax=Austropuccinia psidii MF-1 TaxID=1389203 RepID=A0A9Q3FCQ3_9BASI|nr:hypothetical protein [Austropuccinia psidii MF-1]